jgi:hypothetical protein
MGPRLLLAASLLLSACATVPPSPIPYFESIRGTTQEEVVQRAGKPQLVRSFETGESVWSYYLQTRETCRVYHLTFDAAGRFKSWLRQECWAVTLDFRPPE